ncbi:hypothetical protein DRF65_11630 [Chryseobacterium pennae]|uniref:HNH endonuclease n=1 Tax=Chryseobacterium pennae TaxID=2258962 RepID=A0A3D9C901_9FLAO|nr:HNH endonuclease [Chryseobacterium pennae]REC62355.1 hypothetical protein DRF65_11630 [Chryseobacterium pennae]
MHFTYKYINHEIEKFQKYSDFIFLQVWCKARHPFNIAKFDQYPELQTIFNKLEQNPGEWAQFFVKAVKDIYGEFLKLGKAQKKELSRCYQINNNVARLCRNNTLVPINYTDLQKKHRKISTLLKTFYDRLYGSESPLILKEFGNLKDIRVLHYKAFIEKNFNGHEGVCPFCGLNPIKGNDHSKLEAYDHFIPKAQYPFNSINFKNLAPMCHECNSSYKLKINPVLNIDPLSKNATKRKAFYPYSQEEWKIKITVNLHNVDFKNLRKEEISIDASCAGRLEEIES